MAALAGTKTWSGSLLIVCGPIVYYIVRCHAIGDRNQLLVLVGDRIRQARIRAGISQEHLAHLADLDRSYVGGVERGHRNISALNIIKLAIALKVQPGELLPELPDVMPDNEGS